MFQQFNIDTLGSSFIKSLLAQTPIPVFDSVVDGDYVVEGCYYVYNRYIVKCVQTGYLGTTATVEEKRCTDVYDPKYFSTFVSSTNYYDSITHYHLGRYIRYLYSTTGINLKPYYNCYNSFYLSDVELKSVTKTQDTVETTQVEIYRTPTQKYKVVGVPILFGHTYTIAIDCPTAVLMRACIYDNSGYVDESTGVSFMTRDLTKALNASGTIFPSCRFKHPVTFKIDPPNARSMQIERDLYLVIQLPLSNNSSIVVLEDFDPDSVYNPSLLYMNNYASFAFSDRLIEYLLGNVISKNDTISNNIAKIQTNIGALDYNYKHKFLTGKYVKGVWDESLQGLIRKLADEASETTLLYDQDGYVNKDIENVLWNKGGQY